MNLLHKNLNLSVLYGYECTATFYFKNRKIEIFLANHIVIRSFTMIRKKNSCNKLYSLPELHISKSKVIFLTLDKI